jgi:hypothetical protein
VIIESPSLIAKNKKKAKTTFSETPKAQQNLTQFTSKHQNKVEQTPTWGVAKIA